MKKRLVIYLVLGLFVSSAWAFERYGRSVWVPAYQRIKGYETVETAIDKYALAAERRLIPAFARANVDYPPAQVAMLAMKKERVMELWAREKTGERFVLIKRYPIKGKSGKLGPKLREGDRQIPEGIYSVTHLNPNSSYHLSMKLDYPNTYDQYYAQREGRTHPGSNIFIHGKKVSIGCLAMGDRAIEELFTLAYRTGIENIEVLIAPKDPRRYELRPSRGMPNWVSGLYQQLTRRYNEFRTAGNRF